MDKNIGRCHCDSIEFYFHADPINSIFCYCKECQALTGSDKWFGLWVLKENLKFTKGTPSAYSRVGDSGNTVNYLFCSTCATVLCAEVTAGNFYSVSATSLINNKFLPEMCIYAASAPSWAMFPYNVPKFDTLPPEMGRKTQQNQAVVS